MGSASYHSLMTCSRARMQTTSLTCASEASSNTGALLLKTLETTVWASEEITSSRTTASSSSATSRRPCSIAQTTGVSRTSPHLRGRSSEKGRRFLSRREKSALIALIGVISMTMSQHASLTAYIQTRRNRGLSGATLNMDR